MTVSFKSGANWIYLILVLVNITSCSNDDILPDAQLITDEQVVNGQLKVLTINNSTPQFLPLIKSDAIVRLNEFEIYDLGITIEIKDVNNFILDGNGATLRTNNNIRFNINNCKNIVIRNFKIDNNGYYSLPNIGTINVVDCDKVVLESIRINAQKLTSTNPNPSHQVKFLRCSNSVIMNSEVNTARGELICLESCTDCTVKGNKTYGGWSGIGTIGSIGTNETFGYRNHITENYVYDADAAYITINDRQTIVDNNFIISTKNLGGPGIRFGHNEENGTALNHLRAVDCQCIGNSIYNMLNPLGITSSTPCGIKLNATTDANGKGGILIRDNLIRNCKNGIEVSDKDNQFGTIDSNIIDVTDLGILLYTIKILNPHNFRITNNTISNTNDCSAVSIYHSTIFFSDNTIYSKSNSSTISTMSLKELTSGDKILIDNNKFYLNGTIGIEEKECGLDGAIISGNTIYDCEKGLSLRCNNTLIKSNIIDKSKSYGICLGIYDTILFIPTVNVTILQNEISSLKASIYLTGTSNIKINNNILTNYGNTIATHAIYYSLNKYLTLAAPGTTNSINNYVYLNNTYQFIKP